MSEFRWGLRTEDARRSELAAVYLSRTSGRNINPGEARIALMRLASWNSPTMEGDGDVTDHGTVVYHGPLDFMYKRYGVTDLGEFYKSISQ